MLSYFRAHIVLHFPYRSIIAILIGIVALGGQTYPLFGAVIESVRFRGDGVTVGPTPTATRFPGNRQSHVDSGPDILFAPPF